MTKSLKDLPSSKENLEQAKAATTKKQRLRLQQEVEAEQEIKDYLNGKRTLSDEFCP